MTRATLSLTHLVFFFVFTGIAATATTAPQESPKARVAVIPGPLLVGYMI
jgi:hypothetical protein